MYGTVNFILLAAFWAGAGMALSPSRRSIRSGAALLARRAGACAKKSVAYGGLKSLLAGRKRDAMQRDLSESLSYIQNLVAVGRGGRMSAQLLLEELSELSGDLGAVFLSMARCVQVYDRERAAALLSEALPVSCAKGIGELLAGWEDIAPEDLLSTVEAYRSALREDRATRQKRRDEAISDIVYFPVVLNAMAVLMNFIYIAYFLQQKEALSVIFS